MLADQLPDSRAPSPGSVRGAPVVAAGGGNLPRPLTPLIARDQEVAAIVRRLRDASVRLLTLTGPGGIGKTRLAIAAATDVRNDFPDGVVFVGLAPIADPHLVLATVAGALGLRDLGATSVQSRLVDLLADKRMLLALDNFEHVVAAAPHLNELLGACPGVKMLVTSRIRLRLSGEHEFSVAPLPLPSADASAIDDGRTSGAVRLFVERAQAIEPEFRITAETLPTVAGIVNRVDGLPLAIELAAARIKVLPPTALLQRMEQRLPLLSGGARDLPLRQQTMRDAIRWSYDLLAPAEQALFRRLAVFVGGFTLDAADAIGAGPPAAGDGGQPPAPYATLDTISALIDHSLLRQTAGSEDEPRFEMLETIREFGWERLTESGEAASVREAHAAALLALAEEAEPALWGAGQAAWLDRLDRDRDNVRAALRWTLDQGEIVSATRFGALLWRFWERRGYLSEGRSHLATILALPVRPESFAARCGALTGAGVLAALQGDYDQAIRHSEDALTGCRQIGDSRGLARSLLCLATVARHQDDYAAAQSLGEESLAAFRAIDDRWGAGHALTHLGMVAWVQDRHMEAIALYEEALAHLRDIGDESGIFEVVLELGKGACDEGDLARATTLFEDCLTMATTMGDGGARGAALTELGVVARLRGDHGRATDLLGQASALAGENGDRRQVAYLAAHLGDVDLATGEIGSAAVQYAEALGLFRSMGNRVGIAQCFEAIAQCAAVRGRASAATRLLGSCAALFRAIGAAPPPNRHPATDASSLEPKLSPAAFARAWDAGWALSAEDAADVALALAADLAAETSAAALPEAEKPAHSRLTRRGREEAASPARTESGSLDRPSQLPDGLSQREVEVLQLVAEGLTNAQIAERLFLSPKTVSSHLVNIFGKIGVTSRASATRFAIERGLV